MFLLSVLQKKAAASKDAAADSDDDDDDEGKKKAKKSAGGKGKKGANQVKELAKAETTKRCVNFPLGSLRLCC